tara:strand:+ start:324 stop:989 length:666 start_codon:yes stop_codon:yes gene_type:complete
LINQTNEIIKITNQSFITKINENNENNLNTGNETKFELDFNNIFVLGGISIGGLIILFFTFYIAWKCWLREKIEEMLINFCIGEDGASCLENIFFLKEYFDYLKEIKEVKEDQIEYYGLTPQEIAVCKEAKAINKIKYREALNIRFEELAKTATRPRDPYHKILFEKVIRQPDREIEMSRLQEDIPVKDEEPPIREEKEKMVINILPGTPRRRLPRRSMQI